MELLTVPAIAKPPVTYPVTKAEIEAYRERYASLSADTPAGYEDVRRAIAVCRTTRVNIEARRKELKADSLDYGRRVDAAAKHLTGIVESIEGPLQAKKDVVDAEKARVKAEKEAAERARIEAEQRAAREAEEARLAAERERLAQEHAKLEAERAKFESARRDAERAEMERQAAIRAEEDLRRRAAQERADRERAELEAAERRARLDALRPDAEKVRAYGLALIAVPVPEVTSQEARDAMALAVRRVKQTAADLERFGA